MIVSASACLPKLKLIVSVLQHDSQARTYASRTKVANMTSVNPVRKGQGHRMQSKAS
jgi:hypothetical protein